MATSPRERLIDTAVELFYRHGYHATGIGRILEESGVAKMTLYTHFHSKDELILAALRRRDERFRNDVMRELAARTDDPAERLVLLFDILADWFSQPDFSGCMFINAAAEYAAPDEPIHAAAAEHKRLFAGYLRSQAEAAGARDPDALAEQLVLLMEGAISTAHVSGPGRAAARARGVAELLVRQATDGSAA
ncbi:MAG: TetR/AcrR family transcriptional regulator [Solirubrobacteraceae bacterium]